MSDGRAGHAPYADASAPASITLRAMAASRAALHNVGESLHLVTSGPVPQAEGRDTAVVVRELFERAERGVLICWL